MFATVFQIIREADEQKYRVPGTPIRIAEEPSNKDRLGLSTIFSATRSSTCVHVFCRVQ